MFSEQPVQIADQTTSMQGIYSHGNASCAVLILVGGPQYRVGSHRQFVKLGRALAAAGISSLRFDFTGMGDSEGQLQPFFDNNQAIKLAIDQLFKLNPTLQNVLIWGLCDAASAALLYCYQQPDSRVVALVLLNPWVRQQHSHAQVMLKHYYWQRLSSTAFWQKLLAGGLNPLQSLKELVSTYNQSKNNKQRPALTHTGPSSQHPEVRKPNTTADNYVPQMLAGWQAFNGKILLITSGNDLTAQEFLDLCAQQPKWQGCVNSAEHLHLADANHTFAKESWRNAVEQRCIDFIAKLMTSSHPPF